MSAQTLGVKVGKEIERLKKKLITKAKTRGLYENFGDREIRQLEDKYHYNDLVYGDTDEKAVALLIRGFSTWCMDVDDRTIRNSSGTKASGTHRRVSKRMSANVDDYLNKSYEVAEALEKVGFTDGTDVDIATSLFEYGILRNPQTDLTIFGVPSDDGPDDFTHSKFGYNYVSVEDVRETLMDVDDGFYTSIGVGRDEMLRNLGNGHVASAIYDIDAYDGSFNDSTSYDMGMDDLVSFVSKRVSGRSLNLSSKRKISNKRVKVSSMDTGIYISLSEGEFSRLFMNVRPGNFSNAGLRALYEYLWDYSEGTGEPLELDVIAECSAWNEYESVQDAYDEYSSSLGLEDDEDIIDDDGSVIDEEVVISEFEGNTNVIRIDGGGILVAAY